MPFHFSSLRTRIPGGVLILWATFTLLIHVPITNALLHQALILTFTPYLPGSLIKSNLPIICLLTFAVLRRQRSKSTTAQAATNPILITWLLSMLLQLEWLTSQCHKDELGWSRAYFLAMFLAHLGLTLWLCLRVAHNTLRSGETSYRCTKHRRKLQPVHFVSSPAFGPKWLVPSLYRAQGTIVYFAWRTSVWIFAYAMRFRPLRSKVSPSMARRGVNIDDVDFHEIATRKVLEGFEYEKAMKATRDLMTPVTIFIAIIFASTELRGLLLMTNFAMYLGLDHGFIWNILEMVCHFALEIDDEYFELKRVGDTIEMSRKPVTNSKDESASDSSHRIILSRTYAGCTFMTKDEIEEKGKELIAMSPSYDAVKYNCQGLRDNLFKRILDDRAAPPRDKRRNFGWGSPHYSFLELILEFVFMFYYDLDVQETVANIAATTTFRGLAVAAFPLLWVGFSYLKLVNTVCGIVWSTSTIEGQPFRFRVAVPQLLAPLLVLRALPGITTRLSNISPPKQILSLLTCLRYGLMLAHYGYIILHRRKEYLDRSFIIIEGAEVIPSISPYEAIKKDFIFDSIYSRWISRYVTVLKIEPILDSRESRSTNLLT